MNNERQHSQDRSYDDLLHENLALRQEIENLRAQEPRNWSLFADASRKMQIYSASIKAAVSSLLNYDIFWDHANQHEFLETIDSSVNQVSEMIGLLTLAFRAQANSLVLSRDAHLLQEILSISQQNLAKRFPDMHLEVSFPADGKPVIVDYEYLSKVFQLLFEVFYSRNHLSEIRVVAREYEHGWNLDFIGLDVQMTQIILQMHHCRTQPDTGEYLLPDNILKLHLVCEILHLHDISVATLEEPGEAPVLRLSVPDPTLP
jgi:hypothetical protein